MERFLLTLAFVLQVLLDKNPACKTVVNKVGNIENSFRVLEMELLAGEPSTETEVIQSGLRYRLDYAKVCGYHSPSSQPQEWRGTSSMLRMGKRRL
jgi:tRNA G37 N-methylase Trm5